MSALSPATTHRLCSFIFLYIHINEFDATAHSFVNLNETLPQAISLRAKGDVL